MRDTKKALAEGQSPYDGQGRPDSRSSSKLRGGGGAPVCARAKETLEKAKDCISKELVWKVVCTCIPIRVWKRVDDRG